MQKTKVIKRVLDGTKNKLLPNRIKPKLMVYEVTRVCNSHCMQCNIWQEKSFNDLSLEDLKKIVNDSLFDNLEKVILTGGEPTLKSDLFERIKILHNRNPNIEIWLSTNGLLPKVTEKIVKNCIEENIKIGIGVSLDGLEDANDRIRGVEGGFNKAMETITLLKNLKAKVVVGFTLSNLTKDDYKPLRTFLPNNIPILIQKFDSSSFYGDNKEREDSNYEKIIKKEKDILYDYWIKNKKWTCYAFHSFFVLHHDGNVSPCLKKYDKTFGNMKNFSPSYIWDLMNKERKKVRKCQDCLNDWAFHESLKTVYFPIMKFKIKKLLKGKERTLPCTCGGKMKYNHFLSVMNGEYIYVCQECDTELYFSEIKSRLDYIEGEIKE